MNPRPVPTDFLAVTPAMRKRLEAIIENMLALLDALDGDENMESTGDEEPWLGFSYAHRGEHDLEDDGDDMEPDADGETVDWSNDPTIPQIGREWHGAWSEA